MALDGPGYHDSEMPIPSQIPAVDGARAEPGAVEVQHRNTKIRCIYTNFRNVPYPVFGVCTLAVQLSCISKVCRRFRFESALHHF